MSVRWLLKGVRSVADRLAMKVGYGQSQYKIQRDALKFWENSSAPNYGVNSHWRGCGIFQDDDQRWLSIGQNHLTILERMTSSLGNPVTKKPRNPLSFLEWGCGGGANAVAFGSIADSFFAVDISKKSVDECLTQMRNFGLSNGTGVVIDIHSPEAIINSVRPLDVVVCTYVFELLPTKDYALRLLELFHELLKPGGVAFIQLRYATASKSTQGRSWGYRFGFTKMVAFFLDEFWQSASEVGFRPCSIELLPVDDTVFDERYAYFLLEKPPTANDAS